MMNNSIEVRFGEKKDLHVNVLLDKSELKDIPKLWVARKDKTANQKYYEFFSRCHYDTFFMPDNLKPGDEIHIGIKGKPESKKIFWVTEKYLTSIVVQRKNDL